jgi:hypothetical protein
VIHTCNPRYSGGRDQEDQSLKPAPGGVGGEQFLRPYLENIPTQRRTGRVVQVVERLPSKHEALNSSSSTIKKNNKNKKLFKEEI